MAKFWTPEEDAIMREHYPHRTMAEMESLLGRGSSSIRNRVNFLGLKKTREFLATMFAGREMTEAQKASQFKKGRATWNAGLKGWSAAGTEKTRFKKGHKPQTWKPIGSERVDKDGVVYVKVSDTGVKRVDWKVKQALVWERLHGPIPEGHFVVQRDRSKTNFAPQNLELVTPAENMKRNSHYNNYPPEIARTIQLIGVLNRQINRRANDEQHRHAA